MGTVRDSAVTVVGGGALGAAAAYSLAAAGYRDIQVLEAGDLAAARNSLQLPEATLRRYMRLLGIGPTPRRAASHARNA